jgi:hypothetical protein
MFIPVRYSLLGFAELSGITLSPGEMQTPSSASVSQWIPMLVLSPPSFQVSLRGGSGRIGEIGTIAFVRYLSIGQYQLFYTLETQVLPRVSGRYNNRNRSLYLNGFDTELHQYRKPPISPPYRLERWVLATSISLNGNIEVIVLTVLGLLVSAHADGSTIEMSMFGFLYLSGDTLNLFGVERGWYWRASRETEKARQPCTTDILPYELDFLSTRYR